MNLMKTSVTLSLTLALFGLSGVPRELPDPALADSFERKLRALREHHEQATAGSLEVEVSESEANAYLVHRLADRLPQGVVEPWLRFGSGPVQAGATVDFDVLRGTMPSSPWLQLLSGRAPVELRARIHSGQGVGRLELETVTLGGIPVPVSFVQDMVASYTRSPSRPEGVALNEPFALPYGIESARVIEGRVIIRQEGSGHAATR